MNKTSKIQQFLNILTCLLILFSLAAMEYGKLIGHNLNTDKPQITTTAIDTAAIAINTDPNALRTLTDGSVVVNTTDIARDITGYAGRVPLEITIKDGIVNSVRALDNDESKPFFDKASALLDKWTGKSVDDALHTKVDAVSGATFSSKAIIGNVQRGLQCVKRAEAAATTVDNEVDAAKATNEDIAIKGIVALIVALMAALLPLFVKNRRYHIVQTVANVAVLGFWCGTFVSYTSMLGFIANGWQGWAFAATAVMLIAAFAYPLFGKPSYYCTNMCPFGGLQQLAGSVQRFKLTLSAKTVRRLDVARQVLWALLMLFIWSGMWSSWIDYEPFTAFLLGSASWAAITIAVAFVALSFVVMRPYCRFVCPVGTLLKYSQRK